MISNKSHEMKMHWFSHRLYDLSVWVTGMRNDNDFWFTALKMKIK